MYGELEKIGEEVVMAYFKTLSQWLPGKTDEKSKKPPVIIMSITSNAQPQCFPETR
jgi:hypothetical protein